MGWEQALQVAVGTPVRVNGEYQLLSEAGGIFLGSEIFGCLFFAGSGSGLVLSAGLSAGLSTEVLGGETEIEGVWSLLDSPGRLIDGTGGLGLSFFDCSSLGFQFGSKLTIGCPGRSLTAVGIGRLGLRSLRFMLVAARISSLRISSPFFVGTSLFDFGDGGWGGGFVVY